MEIIYNDKNISGQFLTTEETSSVPVVSLTGLDNNKKYILIMNDPNAVGGNRIHWLVTDIYGNHFNSGNHLLFYRKRQFFFFFNFTNKAALVACSNTSFTPSLPLAEHTKELWHS